MCELSLTNDFFSINFSLQKLLDISTKLHGEGNSLLDLAEAFIEEKRLKQALKIVQVSPQGVAGWSSGKLYYISI